jgi:hypothetical protein
MSVCGGWSLVRHRAHGTEAITMWCRSWLCVDCAPKRVWKLARFASDGQPTTFLTLTVNPAVGESAGQRAQALSDAFKVLVKRARRKFTKCAIEYLAVFEETKRGEPHLHILLRAPFIPQSWISDTMKELINAPIVDIRRVGQARNAARYVSKYLAKGPKPFANLKRYWSSQGYDLTDPELKKAKAAQDTGWRVWQEPLFLLVEAWQNYHHVAVWLNDHSVIFPSQRAGP